MKNKGIDDAQLGSWVGAYKILDKKVFEECLNGTFTGFSGEVFLTRELKMSVNNFNKINTKKMKKNLISKIRERVNLTLEEFDFEDVLIPDLNVTASFGKVNEKVTKTYTNTQNVEVTEPIGQGEFVLTDGRKLVVDANSMLTEIAPAVKEPTPPVATGDTKTVVPVSGSTVPVTVPLAEVIPLGTTPVVTRQAEIEVPTIVAPLAEVEVPLASGSTAPVAVPADSGTTISAVDVSTKTLAEIVDLTKDGEYSIDVTVQGGKIVSADVESAQDLVNSQMMAEQKSKLDLALAEIEVLKKKLELPIGEPHLGFEKEKLTEVTAFSNYEKIARRNNLPIV